MGADAEGGIAVVWLLVLELARVPCNRDVRSVSAGEHGQVAEAGPQGCGFGSSWAIDQSTIAREMALTRKGAGCGGAVLSGNEFQAWRGLAGLQRASAHRRGAGVCDSIGTQLGGAHKHCTKQGQLNPAAAADAWHACRCKADEFNEYGQLFFNPLIQAMRMIVHFGETLPAGTVDPYHLSGGTLMLWAIAVFCLIPFSFGVGAPTGEQPPGLHTPFPGPSTAKSFVCTTCSRTGACMAGLNWHQRSDQILLQTTPLMVLVGSLVHVAATHTGHVSQHLPPTTTKQLPRLTARP